MPAYTSLSYSATDNDGRYGLSDDRGQRWAVEFGSVIAPNFLLAVGYTHVTKYVGAITGTPMSIGFETGIVYGQDTAYELKTDLYLNSQLSAGVSYAESSFAGSPDSAWVPPHAPDAHLSVWINRCNEGIHHRWFSQG